LDGHIKYQEVYIKYRISIFPYIAILIIACNNNKQKHIASNAELDIDLIEIICSSEIIEITKENTIYGLIQVVIAVFKPYVGSNSNIPERIADNVAYWADCEGTDFLCNY